MTAFTGADSGNAQPLAFGLAGDELLLLKFKTLLSQVTTMNELTIPKDLGAVSEITRGLHNPWLIAVWPGIGQVAISAGYYLMSKLGMEALAEFAPRELFEVDHVDVKDGLIHPAQLPRSRFFLWIDPEQRHDIVLFIGEAQPSGRLAFCHALVSFAKRLGIERIFTFAAMATSMRPERVSRVFVAATDPPTLGELKNKDLVVLEEGRISGLNGVTLGEAAAAGLQGACLLGEMPHIFSQFPFPAASLAVIKVFADLAGIPIDLKELQEQSSVVSEKLGELLAEASRLEAQRAQETEEEIPEVEPEVVEPQLSEADLLRIDELFEKARKDRSSAYELKRELDSLGVFKEYEDRFLDLFQNPG